MGDGWGDGEGMIEGMVEGMVEGERVWGGEIELAEFACGIER